MYYIKKYFLKFLLFVKTFFAKKAKKNSVNTNFFSDNNSKSVINEATSLQIKSKVEELQKSVEQLSFKIIKKYFGDIDKTVKILEKKGMKVYRTSFAVNLLKNINEKQGFITPLRGFNAFYLNFMLALLCEKRIDIKFQTKDLFVFSTAPIDVYYLAAQVYKFVAYKKKMPGFAYHVQEKFKRIYKSPTPTQFNSLTAGEIFALKEAIARDVEAVDFAAKLHQETELLNKISNLKSNDDIKQ